MLESTLLPATILSKLFPPLPMLTSYPLLRPMPPLLACLTAPSPPPFPWLPTPPADLTFRTSSSSAECCSGFLPASLNFRIEFVYCVVVFFTVADYSISDYTVMR
jgi:hypothetical protein